MFLRKDKRLTRQLQKVESEIDKLKSQLGILRDKEWWLQRQIVKEKVRATLFQGSWTILHEAS